MWFSKVQEYLEQLPLTDSPDVFGMHENAERAHLESEARRIIDVVIEVQPRLATAKLIGLVSVPCWISNEKYADFL